MAEWSARWTGNPAGPGLSGVSLWPLAGFVLGRSEFKSSAMPSSKQETSCLLPIGFFDPVMCYHEDQRSPSSFILGMLGILPKQEHLTIS